MKSFKFVFYALLLIGVGLVGLWIARGKHAATTQDPACGQGQPAYWYDPMKPDQHFDKPGKSPFMDMQLQPKCADASAGAQAGSDSEHEPLYWYDPMVPGQHFDQPGKSPFMDMQLVAKYAGQAAPGTVSIDPRMAQNLGIRIVPVERGHIAQEVRASGSVMADETRIEVVQSRAAGWVERLHVRAVNDPVSKGQLLAELYSPDLLSAQQEFLLALRAAREHPGTDSLVQASRDRLSFLGLSDQQITRIEKTGQAQRRVAFYSPINGVVAELGVREGVQVMPGMNLFNLVDLSHVWVTAQITETQAAWVAKGQSAEASVPALPGRIFKGEVDYVYPEVMAETRTLKARILLDNPRLELKPGMYAWVTLAGGTKRDALLIPSEALIKTGTRSAVIVAEGEGHFRPVEVTVGDESQGKLEIRQGLEEGQQVVASGQFLIDSEANLSGALGRLTGDGRRETGDGETQAAPTPDPRPPTPDAAEPRP